MQQNKLKNSLAQTRSIAAGLVMAFAVSSCSIEPITLSEDIARNPTVATAPQVGDSPFNAAVAWQVSSGDGDEEATQIFVKLLPDDGVTHTVDGIISPTAISHPVELVRARDHYFLAWIDNTEPPARLRWRILSANDLTLIHEGEYGQEGKLVSDFAAAYHPEEATVLVAILTWQQRDAALDEYEECVDEDGISSCALSWFTVDADTGEISREGTPYEGLARGVSVASGADGFLVAVAANSYGWVDTHPNRVKIYPFDAAGALRTSYAGFAITGANDCSDTPQTVVDAGELLTDTIEKNESNFSETVIAYDTRNDRYLVGYATACDNQYFRARWVQARENSGWVVYGVAEGAYTTAGEEEKRVTEPPFEIATIFTHPMPASEPMLAYNASSARYSAGFSSPLNRAVWPDGFPSRHNFYRMHFRPGRANACFPGRISWDRWEPDGTTFADFVSGSMTAETEGDERKTYYVWEQRDNYVPCLEPSEDYCEKDALDFENAEPSTRSTVYFTYREPGYGSDSCDDIVDPRPMGPDPYHPPPITPFPITP